ncbi:cysteine desulfurase NifS [Clostridia bacterium]|nr:cysteine desulfurase NifS [Clostridia bacterium]
MKVYADHAATAPLRREALDAMMPYLTEKFGNPSSMYSIAADAREGVDRARAEVAAAINAEPGEIYFLGGGTEGDNLAIQGALSARKARGKHIITSAIEHHAVIHTLEYLEKHGQCSLTVLPVDKHGKVSPDDLRAALRDDTALVTIMAANNEIGTIQDLATLGAITHECGAWFHTDAVQAMGHTPIDVRALNIDMLSMAGHKFGGPKGVGAFYLKKGIKIPPTIHGGGHERGLRSGTENVAGIVGLGTALRLAVENLDADMARVREISGIVTEGLLKIPYAFLTGHTADRLPGTVSFVFEAVEGESLVLGLDFKGVSASSGSACSSGTLDPSHVLLAIGLPHEVAHGSLRLSFGPENTVDEAHYVVEAVTEVVTRRRLMSPLWDKDNNKPTERFWEGQN